MKITIKAKLIILVGALLVAVSGLFIINTYVISQEVLKQEQRNINQQVEALIKQNLIGQVDTLSRSVNDFYQQSREANIKQALGDEIKMFRDVINRMYDNNLTDDAAMMVYTFLNEYQWGNGRYLFAYNADTLENEASGNGGVSMGNSRDALDEKGNYYARDIVAAAKTNPIGFTSYFFSNPSTGRVEEKLSASFYFEPLNLVIATGEYVSTLRQDKLNSALQTVLAAKFGEDGHFWVQDSNGKILAHSQPSLIGQVTPNATKAKQALGNQDDAFVALAVTDPKTHSQETQIAYVRQILPEWGWVIGTGTYESNISAIEQGLTQGTEAIFKDKIYRSIVIASVLIIFALAFCVFLLNKIIADMVMLKNRIDTLSTGDADLTSRLAITSKDELAAIGHSVNSFIGYLQAMMLEISQASLKITQGIGQLDSHSENNRQALSKHSNETELVVTAISQMNASADAVAQSAGKMAASTQQANEEAKASTLTVSDAAGSVQALANEMNSASQSIHTMSENTNQIISVLGVIKEIADQTNLLALNAAIEAARAGEQGRGFAVVADEVRSLASRTQSCTTQIEQILATLRHDADTAEQQMLETKNSCQQVTQNTARVTSNLGAVTGSITEINDLGGQIASASEQQSVVTAEISQNMHTIEAMAQTLLQNGQQTLESTQSLSAANQQLSAMVSKFKLA
ncbi:methyl-accepting chemotaxis protein [Shewanella insulae]|uniref:methyl-accepting chemotaxis protein n=1 Tax=Shewanella insulae TaxID=2681496 RepID=UPI001EFDBC95|nr:methyl-accepting chemotaxis protein [Shewanella insulae]MCG9754631.1 methyl-accepting chemotaxis protein [Shewanella insulae]